MSVRTPVSHFRPNVAFFVSRPRLTAGLLSAAVVTSVMVASMSEANAATVSHGQNGLNMVAAIAVKNPPGKDAPGKKAPANNAPAKDAPKNTAKDAVKTAPKDGPGKGGQATAAKATPTAKPSKPAPKPAPQPSKPYTFYDSINPSAIPANHKIAAYADGRYAAERSTVNDPDHAIWIDVKARDINATALDVEPGDARPSEVAGWVKGRLTAHHDQIAIVYTMRSEWAAAKASVATLPAWMQGRVRWWIADPTGHPHIVPGSQATQWYWGKHYDISTALPGFEQP